METMNKSCTCGEVKTEAGKLFGKLYSFNESLKLYHWNVTGKGSYAQHMALDEALDTLRDVLDRLVETSYALYGDLEITIPETAVPEEINIHTDNMYAYVRSHYELFTEAFTQSILDDYMEGLQQLAYRLKRLS